MNELKDLETQLESWTPRRPSSRVKRIAWAAAAVSAAEDGSAEVECPSFRFGWVVPATVAILLSCVLINERTGSGFYASADCATMVAAAMSNQGAATWLPGSFPREQNGLRKDSFEWTNAGGSFSSVSSPQLGRGTN